MEKLMCIVSVVAAWLVAFCVPYLLNDIGVNIGWLFGGFSVIATVYAYFRVPEIAVSVILSDSSKGESG
jgi:amino acid transporter